MFLLWDRDNVLVRPSLLEPHAKDLGYGRSLNGSLEVTCVAEPRYALGVSQRVIRDSQVSQLRERDNKISACMSFSCQAEQTDTRTVVGHSGE
jgi:hypothetical protein